MKILTSRLFFALVVSCLLLVVCSSANAATYTVTNSATTGAGSLDQAIIDANANGGADVIEFNIPETDANFVTHEGVSFWLITPTQALTTISEAVDIDAGSQGDNQSDTNPLGPEIMISGESVANGNGLHVTDGPTNISDLIINGFNNTAGNAGIYSEAQIEVVLCYLGTSATASVEVSSGNDHGISLNNASNCLIGSNEAGEGNVISGNDNKGINIASGSSNNNRIQNNMIGANRLGTVAIANDVGIEITGGGTGNDIGDGSSAGRNIISGNTAGGIFLDSSNNNNILGNYIGVDVNGNTALANGGTGVQFLLCTGIYVGDGTTGGRNIISGNGAHGVWIDSCNSNFVQGNYVGLGADGTTDLGNTNHGIFGNGAASSNTVGGTGANDGNVSSGNSESGIYFVDNGSGNIIQGNIVGLNAAGDGVVANDNNGIYTDGSLHLIGDGTAAGRNVVSGNAQQGIFIDGSTADNNVIDNNYVGVDPSGTVDYGNGNSGIRIENTASWNTVEACVVSGNTQSGILLDNTTQNRLFNNIIGLNSEEAAGIPNNDQGIYISNGSTYNYIGDGTSANANSVCSTEGNGIGIEINGSGTNSNEVSGNFIGTDSLTSAPGKGNGADGIQINNGASYNIIGGEGASQANVISGNGTNGAEITGSGCDYNRIISSYIGIDDAGTSTLANGERGVVIGGGAQYNIIGSETASQKTVISGNLQDGVFISSNNTNSNEVRGCYIGTNNLGAADLGNSNAGVNVDNGPLYTVIGGTGSNQGNIICGNNQQGITLSNSANFTYIYQNYIGVEADGTTARGNAQEGIRISNTTDNVLIGDGASTGRNVVSNNSSNGISLDGSGISYNVINDNYVGVDSTGNTAAGNTGHGIKFEQAAHINTVEACVIGGNTLAGINVDNTDTIDMLGNNIGVGADGSTDVGNTDQGIFITAGAQECNVGDGTDANRNIISGNGAGGIVIDSDETDANIFNNNYIGTETDGSTPLSNDGTAVLINGIISGVEIKNSTIVSDGQVGVQFVGGAGTFEVSDNVLIGTNAETGIMVGEENDEANTGGVVSSNEVRAFGFGISSYLSAAGDVLTIRNNTVVFNFDDGEGEGIQVEGYTGTFNVTNCIVAADPTNEAVPTSFGIICDGSDSTFNVSYSDVYGNTNNYLADNGGTLNLLAGTIETVAKFTDALGDDFTLASNSPCIDTGTAEGVDMGAYQYGMDANGVPAVRLISPNGTESWEAGSAQTITWYASQDADGITGLDLSYSTDSGVTYTSLIAAGESNDGTYSWTLPIINSTNVRISIEATSGASIKGTDESDSDLTIYMTETDGPVITIESPTAGDIWQGGSTHNVTFQATDVKGIKASSMNMYYSTDEGSSYPYTITSEAATTSPYSWTLPTGLTTDEVKIKIDMQDDYNQFGTAESGTFTIDSISPEVGSITLKDISSGGTTYSNSMTVSVEASNVSGSPSQMNISDEATFAGSTWETYAAISQFTFTGSDGTKEVYFKVRDTATNESSSDTDSIIVDTTAPTAPTLVTPTNSSNTNDATPIFTWSAATDVTSGVGSYEVRLAGTIVATTSSLSYTHTTTLSDATYTWEVRARDLAMNYGAYSTTWTFILDTSQIDPTNISINVPEEDVPIDEDIEITFPATMDTESVEDAFNLDSGAGGSSVRGKAAVAGTFTWTADNKTMTFSPTNDLSAGTTYTLSIGTGAKDAFGNALSSAFSTTFTTATGDDEVPTIAIKIRDRAIIDNDYIPAIPTFQIEAEDNLSILASGVTMRLDGAAVTLTTVSTTSTTVELSYTAAAALADEGTMTHILTVEATDAAGNVATSEISGLKVSDGTAKITGGVLTHPTQYAPLDGGVLKVGYQLSTDAQVNIYLISKYGVIHWTHRAAAAAEGGKAGYNEVEFNGTSDTSRSKIPNGLYMIKVISQNKVIGSGHVMVLD